MAKKTHVQFGNIAKAAGATIVSTYWDGLKKRKVSRATFSIGWKPKLIFHVTYSDGQVGVDRPERGDFATQWTLEDFEKNFWLMHQVREFIKEVS